jgi:hypothetical protein
MTEQATETAPAAPSGGAEPEGEAAVPPELEGGNYEVIRARLLEHGRELERRTEALNQKRKRTFGGTELQLLATERVRTEHNCVPRDIVQVGGMLLLGYNVFLGLKSETKVADVFALHRFDPKNGGFDCSAVGLDACGGFLQDAGFVRDFSNLYKYTRDALLLGLAISDTRLLAIFQSGTSYRETKVLRWRIEADDSIHYVDDRGERDHVYPPSHDFEWRTPTADDMVEGRYLGIEDRVFVSTVGGALTLRVEDNTAAGRIVFREPVDDHNQVISDAQFQYAVLGDIVIVRVLPFRETVWRHVVFNARTQKAVRIDAIGQACLELPEDHGILFPGGFCLQGGDHKLFEGETADLEFRRKIASPNGEDVLYVFHRRRDGHYVLCAYNLIRKEVQTPIHCHGYSLFDDGRLVVFRALTDEPTRVHPMQVWGTPFTSAEFAAAAPTDGSFIAKVGNAELVRGVSEALTLCRLVRAAEPDRQTFEDAVALCGRLVDGYYWLGHAEVGDLKSIVVALRDTAELVIDEFEKVLALRQQATGALADAEQRFGKLGAELRTEHFKRVEPFLDALTRLRSLRGHVITLKDLRYVDLARLDALEAEVAKRFDAVSRDCVAFLLKQEALQPLVKELDGAVDKLGGAHKAADVKAIRERLDLTATGLELLSEVVAGLKVEDATDRTRILHGIGEVFSHLNRARATVEARRKELATAEGKAEFAAQFQLLGQAVTSALGLCDTPERTDEQLSRLLVQMEELEGRFSELDEFLGDIAQKREEIYDAFSARKQTLLDERQRRVQNLLGAAERVLEGIGRRSRSLAGVEELNAYFAGDAMVAKVQELARQLAELGDSVKSESLLAKLKTARQDALRGLRDKLELFEEGENVIKLGRHRFAVNTQPLELSMVSREEGMCLHLTGTDFYQPVEDEGFQKTRAFWSQDLVSENADVYRGEYLAVTVLAEAEAGRGGLSAAKLHEAGREPGGLLALVRGIAQDRYDEGYERGVHDHDAARILERLLVLRESAGLLRFAPAPRALAALLWGWHDDGAKKSGWALRARNLGRLRRALGQAPALADLAVEIAAAARAFLASHALAGLRAEDADEAARYLVEELAAEVIPFVTSADAVSMRDAFVAELDRLGARVAFEHDLHALASGLSERWGVVRAWVEAWLDKHPERAAHRHLGVEVAAMFCDRGVDRLASSALVEGEVTELLGTHRRIEGRKMRIRIDEISSRLGRFVHETVPAYRAYRAARHELLERERARLRLDEYKPRVMSAFVRNKLIHEVYLPLVGDNLAKQIGAVGEAKRTDLMGMLLLVSPPGYGKTTLMEYVASRLGFVFVKVNGPALGHAVASIDPAEAPNATARQEVEKINFALEMGNNVLLYLDDIQHTSPELLQKFISLCDAQRRIEGVWRGRTRTYDLRGRKFCVCMAGNPYTESGEQFKIPDMLANRADTYNLGDILQGKEEAFALSFLENALTSNTVLAPLATRDMGDVYKIVALAQGEAVAPNELSHPYGSAELADIVAVVRHLFQVQTTLLKVNKQYILSAAQDERFRTEPPFKLQGSYRNMNRIAEKVMPAMNPDEVERLVTAHYLSESQTLTTGAEANLLKLAELRGTASEAERARWQEIQREFVRHKRMGGSGDDPVARLAGTISGLGAGLDAIGDAIAEGATRKMLEERLAAIRDALAGRDTTKLLDAQLGALVERLGGIERSIAERAHENGAERAAAALGEQLGGIERAIAEAAATAAAATEKALETAAPARASWVPPPTADELAAQGLAPEDAPRVARAGRLAGAEGWLKPYLLRIEAALEALGRPQLSVELQTPPSVDEILKQQVILIERTLVPVVKTAARNLRDGEALAQKLDQALDLLQRIDAQRRGGAQY